MLSERALESKKAKARIDIEGLTVEKVIIREWGGNPDVKDYIENALASGWEPEEIGQMSRELFEGWGQSAKQLEGIARHLQRVRQFSNGEV